MSRSALTRHALQKSLRGQSALEQPPEETQRRVKQDELAVYGNDTTYNLNTLLHQNILQSAYFHDLYKLKTYHEVVDEIYYRVDHAEPWSPGTARIPSSCFCLLHKFFLMRLTRKQMQGLLRHTDSPYIRVVGFLYLRFAFDPDELWPWFEPFLEDPEEFNASANTSLKTTIGEWLISLLEENNYFGTILPRIPKKIEDGIKVKLLLFSRKKERAKENLAIVDRLKPGTKVRAMYADEENEPAMYDAVVDSVEEGNKFWVSFPAYGNTEQVGLGDIEFDKGKQRRGRSPSRSRSAGRSRSRSRGRDRRSRDRDTQRDSDRRRDGRRDRSRRRHRSRSRSQSASRGRRRSNRSRSRSRTRSKAGGSDITGDLLQQVRERERRKAEAVGRDYASRPASYKGSLSLKLDRWTTRKRSRSPAKRDEVVVVQPGMSKGDEQRRSSSPSPEKAREAEKRLKKLRAMYGDASATTKDE
ncbi:Pre-mRNA splicing factor SR-like 1 [Phytophthora ramorum]|uniref:Pre-mRNA splicing factor SR-like 1 n=1 Tax=Phytophthora ramorum TaxID=164328 RepID=UPI0030A1B019|nr:Pre-mRNA splicing factor SR-like 1 [Phytophthora ramorum]